MALNSAIASSSFAYTPPAKNWFYVLAHCNLDGNSAVPRLIIDGSQAGGTGFVLDSSDSILRGLIVDGFGVGVSVPDPGDVGDLIQGDDIGKYPLFPVEPTTGLPVQVDGANVDLTPDESQLLHSAACHVEVWSQLGDESQLKTLHTLRAKISSHLQQPLPEGKHYLVYDRAGCYALRVQPQAIPA